MQLKINELNNKASVIKDYVGDDGSEAVVRLNKAIWEMNKAVK